MLIWLGWIFISIGAAFAIGDLFSWGGEGPFEFGALGSWWFWIHSDSLQLLQPAIERHVSQGLFDPYILTLLEWPAALQFFALGLFFMLVAQPLRRR